MSKLTKSAKATSNNTAANLGFEPQLWEAADALRGSMDAAEYKHIVLGLILSALRYALLPKLIGGQIRVRNAGRFLRERGL